MSVETMRKVTGYCGFCAVHCPVVTTVDGPRVVSVEPDRAHPYGGAICIKGRAAPEFHDHRYQHDPVSGGTPHRSTLCRVVKAAVSASGGEADGD